MILLLTQTYTNIFILLLRTYLYTMFVPCVAICYTYILLMIPSLSLPNPTYTKTIHIDNQYTTYILIIDIYSYILTAYSASPPATHGFVLLGTLWGHLAWGTEHIFCRSKVKAYNSHNLHLRTAHYFLSHCHTASEGENYYMYTRTVQQHPPCSVITAQEVKLQIRLCTV